MLSLSLLILLFCKVYLFRLCFYFNLYPFASLRFLHSLLSSFQVRPGRVILRLLFFFFFYHCAPCLLSRLLNRGIPAGEMQHNLHGENDAPPYWRPQVSRLQVEPVSKAMLWKKKVRPIGSSICTNSTHIHREYGLTKRIRLPWLACEGNEWSPWQ